MIKNIFKNRIRFDRNEFAGSFGDIGTDFPLVVSLIMVAGLDPASVLVMFGAMQILTGLVYGIPMPVQPLKAMTVIVLTQKLTGNILYAGGLAIGIVMFFLTASNLLSWIGKIVPKSVVRGIQFGLGSQIPGQPFCDCFGACVRAGAKGQCRDAHQKHRIFFAPLSFHNAKGFVDGV